MFPSVPKKNCCLAWQLMILHTGRVLRDVIWLNFAMHAVVVRRRLQFRVSFIWHRANCKICLRRVRNHAWYNHIQNACIYRTSLSTCIHATFRCCNSQVAYARCCSEAQPRFTIRLSDDQGRSPSCPAKNLRLRRTYFGRGTTCLPKTLKLPHLLYLLRR